jgi:hypothetical protein
MEKTSQRRLDSQHVEVISAGFVTPDRLRTLALPHTNASGANRRYPREDRIPIADVLVIGIGERDVDRLRVLHRIDLLRLGDAGERPQEHCVHHPEDDDVGSHTESQRQQGK